MTELALAWGRMRVRVRPGTGTLVVFLCGTGCNSLCWEATRDLLPAGTWSVAYDYRGHGESATPAADFTLADLGADLLALLAALGSPPCILVGHSLGGMMAGSMLPQLAGCRGLVLVEGWVSSTTWGAFGPGRYYAGLSEQASAGIETESAATRARVPAARWAAFWETVVAVDNRASLANWPGPVIHQYGSAGRLPSTEAALCLPSGAHHRLEWVEGVGHYGPWLRPDTVAAACVELLSRVAAP